MENKTGQELEEKLTEDLANSEFVKSLDLPGEEEEAKKPEPEEPEEESQEEEVEVEEEGSEDAVQEEGEEEVEDPKWLKAQQAMESRIARLAAENRELKAKIESTPTSEDPTMAKLQKMSEPELKRLKRDVRAAQITNQDDSEKLNQYLDLEEKIDDTLRTAPQRKADSTKREQERAMKEAEEDILADPDFQKLNAEEVAPKIQEIAAGIVSRNPKSFKDPVTHALALTMAWEHFKEMSKYSTVKKDKIKLKQQNNKLKKKTSLDGKVRTGDMQRSNLTKLRTKAKDGDDYDKLDYAVKSGMINPDALVSR